MSVKTYKRIMNDAAIKTLEKAQAIIDAKDAQLRAQAVQAEALQAAKDIDDKYISDLLEQLDRWGVIANQRRDRIAALEQAVGEAREVIRNYRRLKTGPKGYTSMPLFDLHNAADAWLAAHPMPQMCKCGCGCSNVATTDDGSGLPMCESCRRDYLGIPPQEQAQT